MAGNCQSPTSWRCFAGTYLPDEGDEAVADSLGISGVARESLAQEIFLDDDAQGENAGRDATLRAACLTRTESAGATFGLLDGV